MSTSIYALGLPKRLVNLLRRSRDIHTVDELCGMTARDLRMIKGMGVASLADIGRALHRAGKMLTPPRLDEHTARLTAFLGPACGPLELTALGLRSPTTPAPPTSVSASQERARVLPAPIRKALRGWQDRGLQERQKLLDYLDGEAEDQDAQADRCAAVAGKLEAHGKPVPEPLRHEIHVARAWAATNRALADLAKALEPLLGAAPTDESGGTP